MNSPSRRKPRLSDVKFDQDDFVGAGFKRLEEGLVENQPPMIKWGMLYGKMSHREKIRYLERLASAMNNAAYKIQKERDELGRLAELKERQLEVGKKALEQNNDMVQQQLTKMNEERQHYNTEIARLRARVRELEQK